MDIVSFKFYEKSFILQQLRNVFEKQLVSELYVKPVSH